MVRVDAAEAADEVLTVDAAPRITPKAAQAATAAPNREVELNCLRYQKRENWDALVICADQLKQLNAPLAMELRKHADLETRSVPRIRALEAALDKKELNQAKIEIDQIWTGSSSYKQSKFKYENLENQVINELVTRLQRANGGACEMYNSILASERDKNPPRVIQEATNQVKCMPAQPQLSKCDHETSAKIGLEFHAAGWHDRALQAFEVAWNCKPEPKYAERAFINACNIPNTEKAKIFWKRLPEPMQQRALAICVRNGITLDQMNAP